MFNVSSSQFNYLYGDQIHFPYSIGRLVTYAKKDSLHGRRLIQKKLPGTLGKKVANILIHEIAERSIIQF